MEAVSERELKKRNLILNGSIIKAIFLIAIPILFYNLCNYLYGIYDMMVVQKANIGDAADVVVLDQIRHMIEQVGGSLATGGGILIARRIGAGEHDRARVCANTLFTLALVVAALTMLFIPFAKPFLTLLRTDKSTIDNALGYFNVQMLILMVCTINTAIIAIERSKGNTAILLILNLGVIFIKISLSTLFAFGPFHGVTITWLGVATLIAQSFMLISGLILVTKKNNMLRIWFNTLNLKRENLALIIKLSLPVFIGRFLFHFGKVYINSAATTFYGKKAVGALGISNTMAGLVTNMVNSFEDAGSTIVSQNYGNKNGKRIRSFFWQNFIIIESVAVIGMAVCFILKASIARFFAPNDIEYQKMIVVIFRWECVDLIFTGVGGIANAIFYGFGKTRITMAISMLNIFLFRIPTLLILKKLVHMNYEACGVAMFVSNTCAGLISITTATIFILTLHKNKKYKEIYDIKEIEPSIS